MKEKKGYISIALSVIAIATSLIAVALVLLRCKPIEADWMSVLVGILSILVTVLLGWQIFTLMDIRKIHTEVRKKQTDIYLRSEKNLAEYHAAMCMDCLTKRHTSPQHLQEETYNLFQHGISAVLHLSRCNEYQAADTYLNILTAQGELLDKAKMRKNLTESLITILLSVENPKRFPKFAELLSMLCKYQE